RRRRGQLRSLLNEAPHHLRDRSKSLEPRGNGETVKRGLAHDDFLKPNQKLQEPFSVERGDQLHQFAIEKGHRLVQQGGFLLLRNRAGGEVLNEGEMIGKLVKQLLQIRRLHLPKREQPAHVQIGVLIDAQGEQLFLPAKRRVVIQDGGDDF